MGRGARLLCWVLIVVLAAGAVLVVLSAEVRGVGVAEYTIEVVGQNPSPVRRAEWEHVGKRETADELLRQLTEGPDWGSSNRPARLVSDRSFVIWDLTTSRESVIRDTYTYRRWAVVVVELADGTRRAQVLDLPDPRTKPPVVVFRLDDEHRLQGAAR